MKGNHLNTAFFLAIRALSRGNRFTFVLTVAIMGLVFVNLIFLPSIISGVVRNYDTQMIEYSTGNLIIEPRDDQLVIYNVSSLKRRLDQIPEIIGSSPRTQTGVTYTYKGNTRSGLLIGLNPKYDREVSKTGNSIKEGSFLSDTDTDCIVLGTTLAGNADSRKDLTDTLGGPPVGEKILVTFPSGVTRALKVIGIIDSGVYSVDQYGYITMREMDQIMNTSGSASNIMVKTRNNGDEDQTRTLLMKYGIQEKIRTYHEKSGGFIEQAITSFEIINGISTAVSLVIATVVIFIVIFINTINKRRQIGILKAIGINKRVIVYSYLIQVLIISTLGTIMGLALAGVLITYLTLSPLVFPGGAVYPVVDVYPFVRSIASLFIVSLISGFVPAYKIAKEPILEAIRGQA